MAVAPPFVAEIRMFGCNFAPTGWAQCNGQLLPLSQNTALFSLLGTFYGGDGKSTFALPNLQGSLATHQGQGNGLQEWFLGQYQGSEAVTLLTDEMPAHNHNVAASTVNATTGDPTGAILARGNFAFQGTNGTVPIYSNSAPNTAMNAQALAIGGGDQPHNNLMPFVVVNYCIALQGVFPPRT
jgi:microcystin-dependent protein